MQVSGNHGNIVNLPSKSGTLALTTDIPTITDYYWANVLISKTSNDKTTPTFSNTIINGTLNINSGNTIHVLTMNSTNSNGPIIKIQQSGTDKAWFGYAPSLSGLYWFNANDTGIFLKDNNNVGIGTSSPSWRFHVTGASTDFSNPIAVINNESSATWLPSAGFMSSGMTESQYVAIEIGKAFNNKNCGHLSFYYAGNQSNSNRFALGFYNVTDLIVARADGNVGIKTVSPNMPLTVNGATWINSGGYINNRATLILNSDSTANNAADIVFKKNNTTAATYGHWAISARYDSTYRFSIFRGSENGGTASEAELFTISHGGNVGINTNNPTYKLEVAGDIYTSSWSRAASGFYI